MRGTSFFLTVFLAVLITCSASAETYVVRPDGTGDFPTIQSAIESCVDGDIIALTDGTFAGDGNRDLDCLGKAISLLSQSGNPMACVIDSEGSAAEPHRGIQFRTGEGPETKLEGVTLTGGHASDALALGSGGGVFCNASSPTIRNCVLSDNWAKHEGGGIACFSSSSPTIIGCVFSANRADFSGGGLCCVSNCAPVVTDCTFLGNSAVNFGGGIGSHDASFVTITDCRFHGNSATGMSAQGGGMFCTSLATSFRSCVFSENFSASSGGGLACFHSDPLLTGCLFSNNAASRSGGAIYCLGSPDVVNCTFSGNSADVRGGAISTHDASPSFTGCTFWRNGAPEGGALYCRRDSYLVVDNSIISSGIEGSAVLCHEGAQITLSCSDINGNVGGDWVGCIADQYGINGNFSEDPLFCNPETGDLTLYSNSPCLPGNHPDGADCGTIGAHGMGCGATAVEETTWGWIKAGYR